MDDRRMTGRGAWMAVVAQGRMPGATTGASRPTASEGVPSAGQGE